MRANLMKLALGMFMIVTVLWGYIPTPEYLIELTCISNFTGGILLIVDALLHYKKGKGISNVVYQNISLCLVMVFLVCMGSLTGAYKMNFSGAFFFLHVTNPIAFLLCYLFFINERKQKYRGVFLFPIMIMLYFGFDYIRCLLIGEFVYGFIEPEFLTPFYWVPITGVIIYAFMCVLGLVLFLLNRVVHNHITGALFFWTN